MYDINIDRILNRAPLKEKSSNGWYRSNISRCNNKLKNIKNFKPTSLEYLLIQEILSVLIVIILE